MKSLVLALAFGLLSPACYVVAPEDPVATRAAIVVEARRCHPGRVWNGVRCVKRGHGHHKHRHYYYYR